jgi:predicted TPR repeat methyltransferase
LAVHRPLPFGPAEERAPEDSVERLADHFAELFADAPVRRKEESEEGPEEE